MPLPLRTSVFWTLFALLDRAPVMQQPADRVRKASDRQQRIAALPPSRIVVGKLSPEVTATDTTIAVGDDAHDLPVRIYRPRAAGDAPPPVVVYFHGGGFVSGDARQSEWWSGQVAAQAGVVVVSIDYRLAPENPFPAAVDDCYDATAWVAAHAGELGVDAGRLAVMGDSAGGNLATVVALRARDRNGPAIALQVLIYPAVDLAAPDSTYPSTLENAHAPILGKREVDNVPGLYLAGPRNDKSDPEVSPLFAKHENLPSALVQTAQYDPLRDQGYAYVRALREAGVDVRHTNYVGAIHGFVSLPGVVPAAAQAAGEVAGVLRERFDG